MQNQIKIAILFFLIVSAPIFSQNRVKLQHGQEIFVSGINVAWNKYGADVGDEPLNEEWFYTMLDEVEDAGGNAIRWWLFTNGSIAPKFDANGLVSGPGPATIENIRKVLDKAYQNGIVVSLCLLSFDLMQSSQQFVNTDYNKKMLQTDEGRQAFINNALIPIVKAIGKHPAIMSWEIFNEPEGMTDDVQDGVNEDGTKHFAGWTPERVSIKDVQAFINLSAGAIHREMPGVPVSNGSWAFIASSNTVEFNVNYYSDSALAAEGGDVDGYLDFYQVHYYDWAKQKHSPFHHDKNYWELNKAVVIGEFAAHGFSDIEGDNLSSTDCYRILYEKGYAGAMSWTYTAHDGFGGLPEAAPALTYLKENYPEDIIINFPTLVKDDFYSTELEKKLVVSAPGILGNDSDPTKGDVVSSGEVIIKPINGQVILLADGSFTYTPNANFRGNDSFTYSALSTDGSVGYGVVYIRVFDGNVEYFQAPPKASDWIAYTGWNTKPVQNHVLGLQINQAQWGDASLWVVGQGASVQVDVDTSKEYVFSMLYKNDAGSPVDTIYFDLSTTNDSYGPTDNMFSGIKLVKSEISDAQDFIEYKATFRPAVSGIYRPTLRFAWESSDGNGPNADHSSYIRNLTISETDNYIVKNNFNQLLKGSSLKWKLFQNRLSIENSGQKIEVKLFDLQGNLLKSKIGISRITFNWEKSNQVKLLKIQSANDIKIMTIF